MTASPDAPRFNLWRLLPLVALIALFAYGIQAGWLEELRPRALADRLDALQMYVQTYLWAAILSFALTYIIVTALSIPGGAILTLMIGFLFGWMIGGPLVVVSATIGATIIFLIAKTALGDVLRARAGPFLDRLAKGFQEDAFNYLLFLRLVPAFPFWLVNIAPAFLGVRVRTYVITTFFGIIPGTLAYAYAGGSLDSIFTSAQADPAYQACLAEEASGARMEGSCDLPIDFGDLITTEILIAVVVLGILAILPAILRRLRAARGQREDG
jgi:uncharacterized membrane protein YdjX (TVP38/TMEM64 family)